MTRKVPASSRPVRDGLAGEQGGAAAIMPQAR